MSQTIDVTQALKEYDGKDVVDGGTPVTLRVILNNALSAMPRDMDPERTGQPRRLTTEEKERRFQPCNKIWKTKRVKLEVQEAAELIQLVNDYYDLPLVCGRVKQLLEGEEQSVPSEGDASGEQADTDRSTTSAA